MNAHCVPSPASLEQARTIIRLLLVQRESLLDALCTALPFVEDAENDPCFKAGHVKKTVRDLRHVIESTDLAMVPGTAQPATGTHAPDQIVPDGERKERA